MNRGVPSGPSTHSTAPSWQELLRSASKAERCSQREREDQPKSGPSARSPLGRGQPPSGGQPPNCRFCAYAVGLIGVARLACRKPRNASRPRSRPAMTIA
jgi:hypothetical protein